MKRHNAKISSQTRKETSSCNCRRKNECSLNGDCRKSSLIYKCTVSAPNFPTKAYIGLTEKEFKTRWNGHKQSLTNKVQKLYFIVFVRLGLQEKNDIIPTLKWSILNANARNCSLCLQEKFEILFYPIKNELLNNYFSPLVTFINDLVCRTNRSSEWINKMVYGVDKE